MTVKSSRDARIMARRRDAPSEQRRRYRGVQLVVLIVGVLLTLHVGVMITIEVYRASTSRHEITRLQGDIETLERERARLLEVISRRNDNSFREQLARQQGFVYPDEARLITLDRD